MGRRYKRKLGSRNYRNYSDVDLKKALTAVKRGMSLRKAEVKFKIPMKTIANKKNEIHQNKPGRPPIFNEVEEKKIVDHIKLLGEWGQPLRKFDLRMVAKRILDKKDVKISRLIDKRPGDDWANSFIYRHKKVISLRRAQNIKVCRAQKSRDEMVLYFYNLQKSLVGVAPENIINYDETNLTDNPGTRMCIFKRGIKYPEFIQNYSKGSTSIMFAGTASGELLPPYVVYKSKRLWNSWCEGGPKGTRYNRTKSGWFDTDVFEDWFFKLVLPYVKNLKGTKVLIGDNLSSHLSKDVISSCQANNIKFILLPENSTHLTQPLDVAFFAPLKRQWRKILSNFKNSNPTLNSIPKEEFPELLNKLLDKLATTSKKILFLDFVPLEFRH